MDTFVNYVELLLLIDTRSELPANFLSNIQSAYLEAFTSSGSNEANIHWTNALTRDHGIESSTVRFPNL